jgi:hypothetical protein
VSRYYPGRPPERETKRDMHDDLQERATEAAMLKLLEQLKRFSTDNKQRTIRSLTKPELMIAAGSTIDGWVLARSEQRAELEAAGVEDYWARGDRIDDVEALMGL